MVQHILKCFKKEVVKGKFNLGVAYDGDEGQALAVDENGNIIDGDKILAVISELYEKNGTLNKNAACCN